MDTINALLKHFKRYLLIWLSFISAFMTSAGILSTPVALLFFILFIVSINSFSDMTGFSIMSDSSSVISFNLFLFLSMFFVIPEGEISLFQLLVYLVSPFGYEFFLTYPNLLLFSFFCKDESFFCVFFIFPKELLYHLPEEGEIYY